MRVSLFIGDIAETAEGQVSMTATDILAVIGDALNQLTGKNTQTE